MLLGCYCQVCFQGLFIAPAALLLGKCLLIVLKCGKPILLDSFLIDPMLVQDAAEMCLVFSYLTLTLHPLCSPEVKHLDKACLHSIMYNVEVEMLCIFVRRELTKFVGLTLSESLTQNTVELGYDYI